MMKSIQLETNIAFNSTVFLPGITFDHLLYSVCSTRASVFCTVQDISDDLIYVCDPVF